MRDIFSSDVNNDVHVRNVYGRAGGATTGTRAGATTPYVSGAGDSEVPATGGGIHTKPLTWFFVTIVLLVALMWTAQRYGSEGAAFSNVRLSVYNIVVISLAAMVGFSAFKLIFGRIQVPGVSDYVMAV